MAFKVDSSMLGAAITTAARHISRSDTQYRHIKAMRLLTMQFYNHEVSRHHLGAVKIQIDSEFAHTHYVAPGWETCQIPRRIPADYY